jgi:hypothetical protein
MKMRLCCGCFVWHETWEKKPSFGLGCENSAGPVTFHWSQNELKIVTSSKETVGIGIHTVLPVNCDE